MRISEILETRDVANYLSERGLIEQYKKAKQYFIVRAIQFCYAKETTTKIKRSMVFSYQQTISCIRLHKWRCNKSFLCR